MKIIIFLNYQYFVMILVEARYLDMIFMNILVDNKGNFQWISITAMAAVITIFISLFSLYKTNRSNFKGNIVAKSRIEWIQEVRKNSAEFIALCYDLSKLLDSQEFKEEDLETKKEIARLMYEVEKSGTLLTLYFGPDSSENNDIIIVIIKELVTLFTHEQNWRSRNDLFLDINHLMALKDFLRIYFKAEWKRANGELKDSEVQKYLTQNEAYRKIRLIFLNKAKKLKEEELRYYDFLAEEKK